MDLIKKYWIVIAPLVVTLAMSFGKTYDVVGPIKFLFLGFFAAFGLDTLIKSSVGYGWKNFSSVNIPILAFFISLNVALFFSGAPIWQQLFGVTGRNLGYFHYFFLIILLAVAFLMSDVARVKVFLSSLLPLGLFESFYGLVQKFGLDPLPWKNPDSWMLGTFGNPNYLSSFLALSCIASFFSISNRNSSWLRFLHALNITSSSAAILLSNSSQGLILLAVGVFAFTLRHLVNRKPFLKISFFLSSFLIFLVMLFGLLQIGPAKGLIYQSSVSVRGDYWRAGLAMIRDHLFFGVGLDSYGDFYRMYRDSRAVSRNGLSSFSNSAHNIYIDLFATGGIFLFLSYLALNLLVLKRILSVLRAQKFNNDNFNTLATLWLAFQVQSVVSINVAGLAIWGWVAAGLILGFREKPLETRRKRKSKFNFPQMTFTSALVVAFLLPGLLLIGTQARMASAIFANDFRAISDSFSAPPRDAELMGTVAQALQTLKQEEYAHKVARKAVEENPRAVKAWKVILDSSISNGAEKDAALFSLKSLDPFLYLDTLEKLQDFQAKK